jgi:predicted transposase/invertase (TIGR01784 family)
VTKDELDAGQSYDSCPNVISIWLTDYHETSRLHHTHEVVCVFKANPLDSIEIASEKTRIFIIELPKIDLRKASLNDLFSVWMYFLKNPELIPEEFITKVPEVHEVLEELKLLSADKEFRAAYSAHLKAQNDRISRETNAEARGRAEGIAIGEAKGKKEKDGEIALGMLKKGNSIEDIADLTNLSIEEINFLKDK